MEVPEILLEIIKLMYILMCQNDLDQQLNLKEHEVTKTQKEKYQMYSLASGF